MNWDITEDWWGKEARIKRAFSLARVKQVSGLDTSWSITEDGKIKSEGKCDSFEEALAKATVALGTG